MRVGSIPSLPSPPPRNGGHAGLTVDNVLLRASRSRRWHLSQLTLDYIIEHQQPLRQELWHRQGQLRDFVRAVLCKRATGLHVCGPPGTGKTHTVRDVLEREFAGAYTYQRGHLTPMGLFEL